MKTLSFKRLWTLFNAKARAELNRERWAVQTFESTLLPLLKTFSVNNANQVVFDRIEEIKQLTEVFYHWIHGISFHAKMHHQGEFVDHYLSSFQMLRQTRPHWLLVASPQSKKEEISGTLPGFLIAWFRNPELRTLSLKDWQAGILQEIDYLDLAMSHPLAFQKHVHNQDILFKHVLGIPSELGRGNRSTFGVIQVVYDKDEQYPSYMFSEEGIHSNFGLRPQTFYPRLFHVNPFKKEQHADIFGLRKEKSETHGGFRVSV